MNNNESYLFGLLMSDGNLYLTNTKGKVTLEVAEKDRDIIEKLFNLVPNSNINSRLRDTNFKKEYQSFIWSNCQKEFRENLIHNGFPVKDKTNNACIPNGEYSISDFWRGIYDGDGSIGFTKDGEPFISLVTKSENLKNELLKLLKTHFNITKNLKRNTRDKVYNITLKNEDALLLSSFLYKDSSLFLNRKYDNFLNIMKWERIKEKSNRRSWTKEEDGYILSHSIEESIIYLNRTKSSIKNRKTRLKSK